MKIIENAFNQEQLQIFKNYWANNQTKTYVNWELDGEVLDRRLILNESGPEFSLVKEVVLKDFTNPIQIWSAYQRQNFCHHIHIDDYGDDTPFFRYTYVFSLDTVPEFNTIVWKEAAHNNDALKEHVGEWGKQRLLLSKKSNISETQDLEHTYDENQEDYFCDYLTLDGIYNYKAGCGVLFGATQYHCTSNWRKYPQFNYRELLQVHVLSRDPINI